MTGRAETRGAGPAARGRVAVWGGAAALFLAPAVASQVSNDMAWGKGDFALVGAMLLAACGLWELLMRRSDSRAYQAGALVAVAASFLLFLAAGAVGIVGSEDEPVNALFLAVIALALAGALVARFRPRGMAVAMAVAAAAQLLAGIVAVILVPDLRGFLLGTALFTPMWLLSAWLFRAASSPR